MQFNSIPFIAFFGIVFLIYWTLGKNNFKIQNALLLLSSAVFYGFWDWRFLSLVYSAATIDYFLGLKLTAEEQQPKRRYLLSASLIINLGLLFFFKYFNFFIGSFADLLLFWGIQTDTFTLKLILPLGISFYTFQRLSYILDLYRKQIPATNDYLAFLTFSSFFPLIIAGPIERAKKLLPQFLKLRTFDLAKSKDAMRQILWGLFKKIVIADNLAPIVSKIFNNYESLSGIDLASGAFIFAIQIYSDFSGYSDIAIGISRLIGIRVMKNFAYPYFSKNIAEFWRRWHISMSSWFRDYVYTPLSMKISINDKWKRLRNILITFTVSGLWHGANWTFVLWGLLNGLYFIPAIFGKNETADADITEKNRLLPSLKEFFQILITFLFTLIAWIIFRADSLSHAFGYLSRLLTSSYASLPTELLAIGYSLLLLFFEWFRRSKSHPLEIENLKTPIRWGIYSLLILGILVFGSFGANEFFYAQF